MDKDAKIVDMVIDHFNAAKDSRSDNVDKWKRWYDLYRSKSPTRSDSEGKSNIFIPMTFTAIETITPRLVSGYMNSTEPPISVIPRGEEDIEKAESFEQLLTYQFEQINFPAKLLNYYKQCLIYGTSVIKVFWDLDTVYSQFDRPNFEVLDLYDFYVDPTAVTIDDARFCIHRSYISKEELESKRDVPGFKNINKVSGEDLSRDSESAPKYEEYGDFEQELDDDIKRDIEILEYWEDDRIIVVANQKTLICDKKNPFEHKRKPFVAIKLIPVPNEFYGIGIIEPIEGLQNELNTKHNQRLDNVNLILNQMWTVLRGAIDDYDQLKSRPGGIITVNDMGGIKPLVVPDATMGAYREELSCMDRIKETTGATELIQGMSQQGQKDMTATEVTIKTKQASTRIDFYYKLMAETGLRGLGNMFIALDQQFIKEEQVVRIMNDRSASFIHIDPENISGRFDVTVNPEPMLLNRNEELNKYISAFGMGQSVEGFNPIPVLKEAYKKLQIPKKITNDVFELPEQIMDFRQDQLKQQEIAAKMQQDQQLQTGQMDQFQPQGQMPSPNEIPQDFGSAGSQPLPNMMMGGME